MVQLKHLGQNLASANHVIDVPKTQLRGSQKEKRNIKAISYFVFSTLEQQKTYIHDKIQREYCDCGWHHDWI